MSDYWQDEERRYNERLAQWFKDHNTNPEKLAEHFKREAEESAELERRWREEEAKRRAERAAADYLRNQASLREIRRDLEARRKFYRLPEYVPEAGAFIFRAVEPLRPRDVRDAILEAREAAFCE
jgi:hypothetical protein